MNKLGKVCLINILIRARTETVEKSVDSGDLKPL